MNVIRYKRFLVEFGAHHYTFKSHEVFEMLAVPARFQQDFIKFRDEVLRPLIVMSDYQIRIQLAYKGNNLDEIIINRPGQCAYLAYSRVPDLTLTPAEKKSLQKFENCFHVEKIIDPTGTQRRATLNALDRMSNKEVRYYQQAIEKQNTSPIVNPVVKTLVWPGLEKRDYA